MTHEIISFGRARKSPSPFNLPRSDESIFPVSNYGIKIVLRSQLLDSNPLTRETALCFNSNDDEYPIPNLYRPSLKVNRASV